MNIQTTDWDKFCIFYFVSKAPSINKASEMLHISQSALSRAISVLEGQMKTRLFDRGSKGIVLTEAGRRFAETVDTIFNEFVRYKSFNDGEKEEPQGLLKVIFPNTLPNLHFSRLTSKFLSLYPKLRLALLRSEKEFAPFEADAAITTFQEKAQGMVQMYLTTIRMGLYASPEYLQKYGMPHQASELERHRLIVLGNPATLSRECPLNKILDIAAKAGKECLPMFYSPSIEEMKETVGSGLGVAILPEEYVCEESSFIRILPQEFSLSLDLYYVFHDFHKKSKRITAYGNFLADQLKVRAEATGKESGAEKRKSWLRNPSYLSSPL